MERADIIWILVPVYNVEKVLGKCIRSIWRQTFTNWKMILVDDGSTDRSGQMCDEYAKKDPRIRVVHTKNGGLPLARINGIRETDGSGYCVFCDSDDEMPPNALQLLYNEAKRSGAEVVCGNVERILKGFVVSKGSKLSCFAHPKTYCAEEITSELYLACYGGGIFPVNMWGKIYRTSMIRRLMLSMDSYPHYFAEDLNVIMQLLPECKCISVIADVVYRYRIGGGTSRFMPTFLDDNILMYRLKMQWSDKCTSTENARYLIGVELKNIIVSYWIMCEKNHRYPQGNLLAEVKAVCALPEVEEALAMLGGDRSGLPGINQPLVARDFEAVCERIRQKVKKDRPKDILKKILMG